MTEFARCSKQKFVPFVLLWCAGETVDDLLNDGVDADTVHLAASCR